jgi:hypothetical protein
MRNLIEKYIDMLKKRLEELKKQNMGFTSEHEIGYYDGKEITLQQIIEELEVILGLWRNERRLVMADLDVKSGNLPAVVNFNDLVETNLGASGKIEFPRLKILHAGALMFQLPQDLEGESKQTKEIDCVMLFQQRIRGYWVNAFGGEKQLPECASMDCLSGIDRTDGETVKSMCKTCPKSQFGSDPKGGRGQACKEMRRMFMRLENDYVPTVISVPPSSLKNVDNFLVKLFSKGIKYTDIRIKLKLEDAVNASSIHFSRLVLVKSPLNLTEQELKMAKDMASAYMPFMKSEPIELGDLAGHVEEQQSDVPF